MEIAESYWDEMPKHIKEWQLAIDGKVTSAELRQDFIHAHGIALHALGRAGSSLIARYPDAWRNRLSKLDTLDWHRANTTLWEGRALIGGRASKASMNLVLTTNLLKATLGLPLSPSEQQAESALNARVISGKAL